MDKIFTAFFSGVLAIVALILLLVLFGEDSNSSSKELIKQAATEFSDSVREKGYVDPRDYNTFRSIVDSTGLTVNVSMEHYKKRYQPLYTDANNFATFTDEFEVLYEGFYTDQIMGVLYPKIDLPLNDPARRYSLSIGDLFKVYVDIQPSFSENLRAQIFRSSATSTLKVFGGMVRDEP